MVVCLGERTTILPREVCSPLQRLMWTLVNIHERLWDPTGHSENQLLELHNDLKKMMGEFRQMFGHPKISPTKCKFVKNHLNLHLVETIQEFGSMRIVDTTFGESNNKAVKSAFARTNRKTLRCLKHMLSTSSRKGFLEKTTKEYGGLILSLTNFATNMVPVRY